MRNGPRWKRAVLHSKTVPFPASPSRRKRTAAAKSCWKHPFTGSPKHRNHSVHDARHDFPPLSAEPSFLVSDASPGSSPSPRLSTSERSSSPRTSGQPDLRPPAVVRLRSPSGTPLAGARCLISGSPVCCRKKSRIPAATCRWLRADSLSGHWLNTSIFSTS